MGPSYRLAAPLALAATLGCHRSSARAAPAPHALPVLVDTAAPGQLVPMDGDEGAVAAAPQASDEIPIFYGTDPGKLQPAPKAPPVEIPVPKEGPPADGVAAVLGSLLPTARGSVPDPATLPFYDVDLRIEPAQGVVTGRERIDYPNPTAAPLSSLPLRIFADSDDGHVTLDSAQLAGIPLKVARPSPSVAVVELPAPVPAGGWVHLTVAFHGVAPAPREAGGTEGMLQGLLAAPGRSPDYGLFSTFPYGIALAEFLPMVAGRWEDDFDLDPGNGIGDSSFFDLSSFRVNVDLPSDYVLAGPGVTVAEELLPGRRRRTTLALADARDFSLFASSHYREAEALEGGVRVRSIYQNGSATAGQSVLGTARHALALFSHLYPPYSYTTFTAVEVPMRGGAGGAEFPSLIAVAGMAYGEEGGLPGGMTFSPAYLEELREFVVAHEVAHQWWACSVASQPRAQPDVDEPLAQFSAAVYVGYARGPQARKKVLGSQVAVNYHAIRMLGIADGPAARATSAFQNTGEYAGLVYGKAPFFYQALSDRLGDETVSRGLAEYASEHWMGLALRGDVVPAIAKGAEVTPGELQPLFARWFEQAHGDEDLAGRGDVDQVAAEAFGGGDGNLDMNALSKLLSPQQAGNPQAAPGAPGDLPAVPGVDPAQVKQLLQQLNQTMGGVDESQ